MKYRTVLMVVALAFVAAPLLAQGTTVQHDEQVVADKLAVEFGQQLKLSVIAHVTKGAPYSADAVSESVQTLADGNRIVNRTTTRVYRDSEGRTRTEQVVGGEAVSVSISDPISGTTYMLSPKTHSAYQNRSVIVGTFLPKAAAREGGAGTAISSTDGIHVETRELKVQQEKAAAEAAAAHATFTFATPATIQGGQHLYVSAENKGSSTREDLGEQLVEGLLASGTRTTTVIPAGAIGNEQPLRIVSEEWVSKDLGIQVVTKFSDPRTGETTYRVTNINRAEPDPTLFQLPADYKVQQSTIKRDGW